jgi:MATE family multidrug resistance protein
MQHPRAAKYSFLVTMFQSLLLGIIFMTVVFLSKQDFPMIFTKSEDMIHGASELAYLLGITMILNSVAQTISGE